MSDPLRELIASFVIEVDKAGALAAGNAAIDALKKKLEDLQRKANGFVPPKIPTGTGRDERGRYLPGGGFGAPRAPAFTPDPLMPGPVGPQFGPTRDTLNAGRAQLLASEQAAAAYAKTLRGRLGSAVDAVRAGFNGGSGSTGSGPGLIASLATARNAFLAFAGGTAVRGVMHLVDSIGDISEAAARLGVTVEQFQKLRVVAEQNGTSVEALGTAFRTLANAAVQPTKESTKAFAKLGVTVKDSNGQFKSTNDLFFEVSKALAGIENETTRTALAQDLLGRSAIQLKPIFAGGTASIDEMRKSMDGMTVLSAETVRQADELSDSWKTVGPSMLSAAEPLLKILIPALKTFTEFVVDVIDTIGKWLKQTDLTSVALTALGAVMVMRVIPGLQLMIGLGGGAARVFLTMAGSAMKAAWAFAKVALPLLLIEDFIGFLNGDSSVTGRLLDKVFGKGSAEGTLQVLRDVKQAFIDLWDAATGKNVSFDTGIWKTFKDIYDLNKASGPKTLEEAAAIERGEIPANRLGQPAYIPGPPGMANGGQTSSAPSVQANGDRIVQITMGQSASASDVARATSTALAEDAATTIRLMGAYGG